MATRTRTGPPPARRLLLVLAVVTAIVLCGSGIGAAAPSTTPTPPPPTPTTSAPAAPPSTTAPAPAQQPGSPPFSPGESAGSGGSSSDCGVTHISDCVADAIDGFFVRLVDSALNPLLDLLSQTLLTTPEPSSLPRIGELWSSSWQLVLAMYGLVVMAAGVLLMVHETMQTRWGWREIVPRLVAGFLASAMSFVIATEAIRFANALASALAGDGVSPDSAAGSLRSMMDVGAGTAMPLFFTLLRTALVMVLAVLVITYVIRLAVTVVLVVAAPLAMMCWAIPATEPIARWWWRAFSACLAIQVVQSLVLITGLRVFLAPGQWWLLGPTKTGLVSIVVALAMAVILVKIPFWLLSALKISPGRGVVSSMVRGFVTYRTLGLLRSAGMALTSSPAPGTRKPPVPAPDPFAKVKATRSGQLMLPLSGVHRVPPKPAPPTRIPAASAIPVAAPQGTQLMLPLPIFHGGVNLGPTPVLGRNGQYQLPIPVQRVAKPAPPPTPPVPRPLPGTRAPQPKQLAFDYNAPAPTPPDPYAKIRPTRSGQYPLPIEVRRTPPPRTATPPSPRTATAPAPTPPRVSSPAGRQLHLPLPDLPVRRRNPRRTPGKGSK